MMIGDIGFLLEFLMQGQEQKIKEGGKGEHTKKIGMLFELGSDDNKKQEISSNKYKLEREESIFKNHVNF